MTSTLLVVYATVAILAIAVVSTTADTALRRRQLAAAVLWPLALLVVAFLLVSEAFLGSHSDFDDEPDDAPH